MDLLDHETGRPRQAEASARSGVTRCMLMPSQGRTILPPASPSDTMRFTMLDGVAKPMPTEPPVCE